MANGLWMGIVGLLCLQETRPNQEEKGKQVTLTMRKDNGEYGTSAYSFRFESQDMAVHSNFVDLLYNSCGLMHFNVHGGMESQLVDLGKQDLSKVSEPPKDGWLKDCVLPQEGHVYLLKIDDGEMRFSVKFRITKMVKESVEFRWVVVGKRPDPTDLTNAGAAGTMGQCAGKHDSE